MFWLILAGITLLSAIYVWVFVVLLRRSVKLAMMFLALLFVETAGVALATVYTFGGAFGPGILLCIVSPAAAALALICLLLMRRAFFRQFPEDQVRRWFYVGGGLTIVIFQLAPIFGQFAVNGICFSMHQREAEPIIEAVEAYRQRHGSYPATLDELVPEYLEIVPVPPCSWLSSFEDDWEMMECRSGAVLLTTQSVDGVRIERYSFKGEDWSAISFLDGACSFLDE
ncbi:MAG: hypothetical protein SXV54_13130 [Chloroflexota bacterium]|nr:hypothetical protein [Chloroflexota bacterium]